MSVTRLVAPAKLTLDLEVVARRADGMHELRSEMVTLDLADELEVDDEGDGAFVEGYEVPGGPTLVTRALEMVGRRAGVLVRKHIPVGGGLGGGSADAAAILRWAGGVSAERAVGLGSDVPFCQVGGRALVEGAGERITELPYVERRFTLVLVPLRVDTGAVYRVFDELSEAGERPTGRNHLRNAAFSVEPRLGEYAEMLVRQTGDEVHLAGSGSTLFLEGWVDLGDVRGPGPFDVRHVTTTPRAS